MIPPLDTHDGRRAWAYAATFGASLVFTVFAAVNTYLLRNHAEYLFWLAMANLGLLLVCVTAFGWAMGRRLQGKLSKDGAEINDSEGKE